MKFNVAKCHPKRKTKHHKQMPFDYSLRNQILENVQSVKYLGITITDSMDLGQTSQKFLPTKTLGFLFSFAGTWL